MTEAGSSFAQETSTMEVMVRAETRATLAAVTRS